MNLLPPHNLDIEKYVIGSLMLDKSDEIISLNEEDFYKAEYQLIFKAIGYLKDKKKTIDILTTSNLLKKKMENAMDLLTDCINSVVTTANFKHQVEILKDYSVKRQILNMTRNIQEMVYEYGQSGIEFKSDVLELIDSVKVQQKEKAKFDIKTIMGEVLDDINESYNATNEERLFTGFYDLDRVTAGLHSEEVTIIAARPGIGKTAFAINLMNNIASKGNNCLLISREMSRKQLGKRILSIKTKINGHKFRLCKSLQDNEFNKITEAYNKIIELPIHINDKISTIEEIRGYCRTIKNKNKLDVLIIDYLHLLKSLKKHDNSRKELEYISRSIKELSREFEIPVILLSQLSRANEKEHRKPVLGDLRETGAIEQDADNVLFLHIPKDTDREQDIFDIELIIAKQRNGPTGSIYLAYARQIFSFYNKSLR